MMLSTIHAFSYTAWRPHGEIHYIIILFILHLWNLKSYTENKQVSQIIQWVVKLRFDPRQWDSRAPRIALLPGVVDNIDPVFNCTPDAYYLCDLRETTLIQLINFIICQMEIIITHLIDMLWEINALVFRIF